MKKYRHKKISEMERLEALGGEELIPCVSGGKNKAMEAGLIKAAVLDELSSKADKLKFFDLGAVTLPETLWDKYWTADFDEGTKQYEQLYNLYQSLEFACNTLKLPVGNVKAHFTVKMTRSGNYQDSHYLRTQTFNIRAGMVRNYYIYLFEFLEAGYIQALQYEISANLNANPPKMGFRSRGLIRVDLLDLATKTELTDGLDSKVPKVEGMGLSTNDFTDVLKAKLEGLQNYDDAGIRAAVVALHGELDTILGEGASDAIDTFNEIEAFLAGITDKETLTGLMAELRSGILSEIDDKLTDKVDKVDGKGLSTNDYTDADKAEVAKVADKLDKVTWDGAHEQFGLVGFYHKDTGVLTSDLNYRSSPLLPLDRNHDLLYFARSFNNAATVSYFASDGTYIGYVLTSSHKEEIVEKSTFPDNAAYFAVSTVFEYIAQSYYSNGTTIESRNGAIARLIATKLDKDDWDNAHEQFGISGQINSSGTIVSSANYICSPFIPLNRKESLKLDVFLGTERYIAFYDANFQMIQSKIGSGIVVETIAVEDYPDNACYFVVATLRKRTDGAVSCYHNGTTFEAREGAVSDAILASGDADLIKQAKIAGVAYNPVTGFFGLNGLSDITAEEMRYIFDAGRRQSSTLNAGYISNTKIRTHLLRVGSAQATDASYTFYGCTNLETVEMHNLNLTGWVFHSCSKLKSINRLVTPIFNLNKTSIPNFKGCVSLVEIRGVIRTDLDIDFSDSPLLSLASFQYMVDNALHPTVVTIIVHPDVYAKLTNTSGITQYLNPNLIKTITALTSNTVVTNNIISITRQNIDTAVRLSFNDIINAKAGDKFTLSFDVEGLADNESVQYYLFSDQTASQKIVNGKNVFKITLSKAFSGIYTAFDDGARNYDYQISTPIKISNMKLEWGHNDNPQYTPYVEITDTTIAEQVAWANLLSQAVAKNITFATTD